MNRMRNQISMSVFVKAEQKDIFVGVCISASGLERLQSHLHFKKLKTSVAESMSVTEYFVNS